jgi:hypothetical protein
MFFFSMTDAHLECLRYCNAVNGETEPIICRHRTLAEVKDKEDLESSYFPSEYTKTPLSYNATATSRARSRSQLTLVQALAMAQELLRYQPTDDSCDGWLARIVELIAIAEEDPA